jgi:hypothetical protein
MAGKHTLDGAIWPEGSYWLLFSIVMFTLAFARASLTFAITPFKHVVTAGLAAPSTVVETLPASFTRMWI